MSVLLVFSGCGPAIVLIWIQRPLYDRFLWAASGNSLIHNACVEGSVLRVPDAGPSPALTTRTGAGVRKPSGKEAAGRCVVPVRLALWGLQRETLVGAGLERHREHHSNERCAVMSCAITAMVVPSKQSTAPFSQLRTRGSYAGR